MTREKIAVYGFSRYMDTVVDMVDMAVGAESDAEEMARELSLVGATHTLRSYLYTQRTSYNIVNYASSTTTVGTSVENPKYG